MENTIAKLLTLSQEEYEDKLFQLWLKYCCCKAHNPKDLQRLLANTALNKWFLFEVSRLEDEWWREIGEYESVLDPTTSMSLYNEKTINIFMLNCPPLMAEARKLNIIPQLN